MSIATMKKRLTQACAIVWLLTAIDLLRADTVIAQTNGTPAGSGNDIQHATSPPSRNPTTTGGLISGNIVDVATQYNIAGTRILSVAGTRNLFAGVGAGQAQVGGHDNAFFGRDAGLNNTGNAIAGNFNSFFGSNAGMSNTSGGFNSFFGSNAGASNVGNANLSLGSFNSFFGTDAGLANTANDNAFFGTQAGNGNTTGERNSFFGRNAGSGNVSGSDNTIIGANAGLAAGNLSNTTAIGAGAVVTQSNSIVLGNNANVGIGTTNTAFVKLGVLADSVGTTAVAGTSSSGSVGVRGESNGNGIGVFGLNAGQNGYAGRFDGNVIVFGRLSVSSTLAVGSLGVSGGTQLCLNGVGLIAACSGSGPQDIAKVEYDRLINAVRQQQDQIDRQEAQTTRQEEQIARQQRQIDALQRLICSEHPQATACSGTK